MYGVCVSHFHTIHSSVDTYLGCFHALVIVTNTTMKVEVLMSFWHTDFIFFGCVPRSGITGLYRSFTMNFLRNRRSICHSVRTSLYSHRMYRASPFSTSSSELLSFWWQASSQVWSDSSVWFWFAFPQGLVMLSIFSFTCWPLVLCLWKNGCLRRPYK